MHLGLPVEDLSQKLSERLPEWMHLIPAKHLAKHMPDLDTEPMAKSTCVYTVFLPFTLDFASLLQMTDDLNFIIDRHPQMNNVFIAGGFSGTGFKFALTVGNVMARWVQGKSDVEFDLSAFRLDRKIDTQQKAKL